MGTELQRLERVRACFHHLPWLLIKFNKIIIVGGGRRYNVLRGNRYKEGEQEEEEKEVQLVHGIHYFEHQSKLNAKNLILGQRDRE